MPELGRQPVRAPAPVGSAHLDKSLRDPFVVEQIELPAPRDRIFNLVRREVSCSQLLDQLASKVITPRQQVEGGLISGSVSPGHESTRPRVPGEKSHRREPVASAQPSFPNSNGDSSEKGSRSDSVPSSSTPSISSREMSEVD